LEEGGGVLLGWEWLRDRLTNSTAGPRLKG
jgi:hypothetical protein